MSRMSMQQIEAAFAALGLGQESERQRLKALASLGEGELCDMPLAAGVDDATTARFQQKGRRDADVA